jgi:hypothetical protein
MTQVLDVLDFLDERLPGPVVQTVIQQAPRILETPVTTFIQPRCDFLQQLWGTDLFVEEIQKNPRILLQKRVKGIPRKPLKMVPRIMNEITRRYNCGKGQEPLAAAEPLSSSPSSSLGSSNPKGYYYPWTQTRQYLYKIQHNISMTQVLDVLDFLDERLPGPVVQTVIQQAPRILEKPVTTFIQPRCDFLQQFLGTDLFVEEIQKNPKTLVEQDFGGAPLPLMLVPSNIMDETTLRYNSCTGDEPLTAAEASSPTPTPNLRPPLQPPLAGT